MRTGVVKSRFFLSQMHHLSTITDDIALHASLCGESVLCKESVPMADISSLVDASKDFKICINRDDLIQRGFIQWQRQKKGSPANKVNVTFIGEAGIDTGVLRK
ncbi:hypothetical protein DPEC_G00041520 [Dallia pectoralis]|uniref:Uncharacterized protein n=1 Tax=Dallia pectoralis TaxID=75939 RepID=A0ACC2HEY5_DALPE|nr:hypothetical protein DPEC_G00041520 [Dallia pectoralis]